MKCNDCGFESEQSFSFCPGCGAGPQQAAVSQNGAAMAVLAALKDNLFFVICILMSASCILSLAAGNLPLISILTTVFLWLTYAQSRKDIADPNQLRSVSGTVFAQYVITYVAAGLLLLAGVILAATFSILSADPENWNTLLADFIDLDESFVALSGIVAAASGGLLMVLFIFAATLVTVFNIFSMRYIHGFAKSVYRSIETGVLDLKYTKAAQNWLFVFGAFSGLDALGSLGSNITGSLCSAASCGACIIAGLLIRKYLNAEK